MSETTGVELPRVPLRWHDSQRIVPAGLPPLPLFELTDDPEELEIAALAIGGAETIDLALVPRERRVSGPGSSPLMAPFVFPGPSRFGDGRFGIYYAANDLDTAIAETAWHVARGLTDRESASIELERQVLSAPIRGELHELVGRESRYPGVDSPLSDDYAVSRALGYALFTEGSTGLVYRSVRRTSGLCAAVFDPRAVGAVTLGKRLRYRYEAAARRVVEVAFVESLG